MNSDYKNFGCPSLESVLGCPKTHWGKASYSLCRRALSALLTSHAALEITDQEEPRQRARPGATEGNGQGSSAQRAKSET